MAQSKQALAENATHGLVFDVARPAEPHGGPFKDSNHRLHNAGIYIM